MTKEEKKDFFKSKKWGLFENGELIGVYPSRASVKRAQHYKIVEASRDWLDLNYTIKKQQ